MHRRARSCGGNSLNRPTRMHAITDIEGQGYEQTSLAQFSQSRRRGAYSHAYCDLVGGWRVRASFDVVAMQASAPTTGIAPMIKAISKPLDEALDFKAPVC